MTALVPVALVGCSSAQAGPAQLTWYINPDNGGQKELAEKCTANSNGGYTINIQTLPTDADAQREQLVRRLAANDPSIDLMSLDPPFVAEFANAGYLLPFTNPADVQQLTADVLAGPLKTASWQGKLVAAPFWANTQLLWFRKSVMQNAGMDPTVEGFTWDTAIDAAAAQGKTFAVQGRRYEGYMVLVNALIASAGGQIIKDTEKGNQATPSVAGPAGDRAAEIIRKLAHSPAAAPDLSTATEEEVRSTFQGPTGAFMVNWPYVYGAAKEAVEKGALDQSVVDDIGWARYPRAMAGRPSAPPLGGIDLAIGNFTQHADKALEAAKCITSVESNVQYMVKSGNPAARGAAYDAPEVRAAFPMADLIRTSINDAGPRPITPYYGDVSVSVQRNWHPQVDVQPVTTPTETDVYMGEVLRGERLL